jgi:hypothetical protein
MIRNSLRPRQTRNAETLMQILTTKHTKDTKGSNIYALKLRELRAFVVKFSASSLHVLRGLVVFVKHRSYAKIQP